MSVALYGKLHGAAYTFKPAQGLYSDNTPWFKGLPPEGMVVEDVIIKQSGLGDFIGSLMYLTTAFADESKPAPKLVIPFFPGARQDRVNLDGDVLPTKEWLMSLVSSCWADELDLTVFDIHSDKHMDVAGTIQNVSAAAIIAGYISRGGSINPTEGYYDTVIAPDHGATQRAEEVAALFHVPVAVADKVRDTSDGRITSYEITNDVSEMRKVLVVDDICDGGATFEILAASLPAETEKHLYVTHGLFSRGVEQLKKSYTHIVTTDSVYAEKGVGIQVIDLFPGVDL